MIGHLLAEYTFDTNSADAPNRRRNKILLLTEIFVSVVYSLSTGKVYKRKKFLVEGDVLLMKEINIPLRDVGRPAKI